MSAKTPVITPIPGPTTPANRIFFVLSARDLPRRERGVLGSTVQDPYVKWSHRDRSTKDLTEGGRTKHRVNEMNPDWYDNVFAFDYNKATGQLWTFAVWDFDPLNKDDAIGFVDIDVDSYVLDKKEELSIKLSCGGTLLIKKCTPVQFRLSAEDLPKLDPFGGLSDPYVKCYWSFGEDGPATLFATTKTIKNVEKADWDEVFEFPCHQFGTNQYWRFKVFDKDPLPKDDSIGEAAVNVDNYLKKRGPGIFKLSKDEANAARLIVKPL